MEFVFEKTSLFPESSNVRVHLDSILTLESSYYSDIPKNWIVSAWDQHPSLPSEVVFKFKLETGEDSYINGDDKPYLKFLKHGTGYNGIVDVKTVAFHLVDKDIIHLLVIGLPRKLETRIQEKSNIVGKVVVLDYNSFEKVAVKDGDAYAEFLKENCGVIVHYRQQPISLAKSIQPHLTALSLTMVREDVIMSTVSGQVYYYNMRMGEELPTTNVLIAKKTKDSIMKKLKKAVQEESLRVVHTYTHSQGEKSRYMRSLGSVTHLYGDLVGTNELYLFDGNTFIMRVRGARERGAMLKLSKTADPTARELDFVRSLLRKTGRVTEGTQERLSDYLTLIEIIV